jgi:hypothetical protein
MAVQPLSRRAAGGPSRCSTSWFVIDRALRSETWQVMTVDLTACVGQVIRVRFVMETLDVTDTDEPDEWYLDDLRVEIESPQA